VKTPFRDLSIRSKLTVMQLVASGVAVLLLFALVLGYQVFLLRDEIVRKVASLSQVVGENSAAALTFGDPKSARETLSALGVEPNVLAARILDRKGQTFALFARAGLDSFATAVPDPGSLSTLVPYGEDGAPPVPIRYAFFLGPAAPVRGDPARSGDHRAGRDRLRPGAVGTGSCVGTSELRGSSGWFRCCLRTCCRAALTAASRSPC